MANNYPVTPQILHVLPPGAPDPESENPGSRHTDQQTSPGCNVSSLRFFKPKIRTRLTFVPKSGNRMRETGNDIQQRAAGQTQTRVDFHRMCPYVIANIYCGIRVEQTTIWLNQLKII